MVRAADSIFEKPKWKNQDYEFPHGSLGRGVGTSEILPKVFSKMY
jgi:hypothetical protein